MYTNYVKEQINNHILIYILDIVSSDEFIRGVLTDFTIISHCFQYIVIKIFPEANNHHQRKKFW